MKRNANVCKQWLSILMTMITREWTSDLLMRIAFLVILEWAVDEFKVFLCEKRGIPVRRVTPNVCGNVWFVLVLVFMAIATCIGALIGIKSDCYLFGPQ